MQFAQEKINFNTLRSKSFSLFFIIILTQLFYITVLTKFEFQNLASLAIVGLVSSFLLNCVIKGSDEWSVQRFRSRWFTLLFFASAISTLLLSRSEYISSTIINGLAATRLDVSIGGGGWYSLLNSLFYPLALLSAFYKKDCWESGVFFILTLTVCIIDVVFIGTRNSVFFVIIFWFLFSENFDFKNGVKGYIALIFISVIFLTGFEYTTRARSGFEGDPLDYWLEKAVESRVMAASELNTSTYESFGAVSSAFLPLFYLVSYISHSIPEFLIFIRNFDNWFGSLAHLHVYYLTFTFQDAALVDEYLAFLKFRPGYYQTFYASMIVDFGIFVLLVPAFAIVGLLKKNSFLITKIYLAPVFVLSTIENYLYTGLTPLRFLIFIVLGHFFLKVRK